MNFVELFNVVARAAKPAHLQIKKSQSLDDKLIDLDIDSLDGLVMGMYLFELYGIDEEKGQRFYPETVNEYHHFLMENKTKEPSSIEEAKEQIQ
jgi:hypothetical protein